MPKMEPMHNRNRSLLLYVYSLPQAKAANRMMLLFKKVSARRGVNHFYLNHTSKTGTTTVVRELHDSPFAPSKFYFISTENSTMNF